MTAHRSDYQFSMVDDGARTRMVALGLGGMGKNAMENLATTEVRGLELYSVNTDMQSLDRCVGSQPVQIGAKRTAGKGAGGDSEVGKLSAEDDIEKLRLLVEGAELVFIAAGMGGGTGTGAAPVIAKLCREMGILSIAIVTTPMSCEGKKRTAKSQFGLTELRKHVDSLVVIENENLSLIMDNDDVSIIEIFKHADSVLLNSVSAIESMINCHGYINLDLADLRNVLKRPSDDDCANAIIGVGRSSGDDRAVTAALSAIENPLLANGSINGALNILVNVSANENMGLNEAHNVVETITDRAGAGDREIFMGIVTDNSLEDEMVVTLIATGMGLKERSKLADSEIAVVKHLHKPIVREVAKTMAAPPVELFNHSRIQNVCHNKLAGSENSENFGTSPLIENQQWLTPAYERRICRFSEQLVENGSYHNRMIDDCQEAGPLKRVKQANRRIYHEPALHAAC